MPMTVTADASVAPPLVALFLIRFDNRAGYTIAWKRSLDGIDLDGVVEYKSLPSGLHNVKQDLVYFTYESCAGLSSFRSAPAGENDRGATFAAIGCMVKKNGGRLGQIWLHASMLEHLSSLAIDALSRDESALASQLEQIWTRYQSDDAKGAAPEECAASTSEQKRRKRAYSESTALLTATPSTKDHPIQYLEHLIRYFGPLTFPLYRAALLRRRILLMSKPPLEELCHYVYGLSIISSVPETALQAIESTRFRRSRSLFAVGVNDIPLIRAIPLSVPPSTTCDTQGKIEEEEGGYIACSSDDLLKTKKELFDVSVNFAGGSELHHIWPIPQNSDGHALLATQRDLRRYLELQRGLRVILQPNSNGFDHRDGDDDTAVLTPGADTGTEIEDGDDRDPMLCVETAPWAAVAYDSFVWWASAGEQRTDLQEEGEQDQQLLNSAADLMSNGRRSSVGQMQTQVSSVQAALVSYFHKLTASLFHVITELLDAKAESPSAAGGEVLLVSKADMARMGLDVWSKADRQFIQELVALYFGIETRVQGAAIECCGVRLL